MRDLFREKASLVLGINIGRQYNEKKHYYFVLTDNEKHCACFTEKEYKVGVKRMGRNKEDKEHRSGGWFYNMFKKWLLGVRNAE